MSLDDLDMLLADPRAPASIVRRHLREHANSLVRRYAMLRCPAVSASMARGVEDWFETTFDDTLDVLDRLNAEILRR